MAVPLPIQQPRLSWLARLRRLGARVASLVLVGLVFGCAYQWAVPRFYRPEASAGFWQGTVHGALMPTALPSLLLGNDVPIYAARNTGRSYKIGYIAGINLCGLIFFGLAFRRPQRPQAGPER
jgi:cytosine/uracil/thiamine/allantoin permease